MRTSIQHSRALLAALGVAAAMAHAACVGLLCIAWDGRLAVEGYVYRGLPSENSFVTADRETTPRQDRDPAPRVQRHPRTPELPKSDRDRLRRSFYGQHEGRAPDSNRICSRAGLWPWHARRCALLSFRAQHNGTDSEHEDSCASANEPRGLKALVHPLISTGARGWDSNIPASEWAVILVTGNRYWQPTLLPASHGLINFALSTIAFVAVAFLDLSD
jgi:hypothetical protein